MTDGIQQARFVDLNDDELKEAVGSLHEYCKRIEEARKADSEINELKERAKELDAERYSEELKAARRRLMAARKVAESRGIKFKIPTTGEE
jgi:predicted deacetylase